MSRTVENKIMEISPSNSKTYGELIMEIVQTPRSINGTIQPLSYDDLKKIQRVDNVISANKLKSNFVFEDADYDFIKERLGAPNFGWATYNKKFIEFTEYINDIPLDKELSKKK